VTPLRDRPQRAGVRVGRSARLPRRGGRLVGLGLLSLLGAIVLAEPAIGGTVSLESGVLSYHSAPRERDGLRAALRSRSVDVFEGLRARVSAGVGCEPVPADDTAGFPLGFVRCPLASGAPAPEVDLQLGDAHDRGGAESLGGMVDGGPGDDTIFGCGLLIGRSGRDHIHPDGQDPYRPGEGGCRNVEDSARAFGGSGEDYLSALNEPGPVLLDGGTGDDFLQASLGADRLRGGAGADHILAEGRRGDVIEPGPGRDRVTGEFNSGNDTIRARDGSLDYVECGGGRDTVALDGLDFYAGPLDGDSGRNPRNRCERVRRRGPARPVTAGATAYFEATPRLLHIPQNSLEVDFACPYDGPRPCAGTFIVKDRRRVLLRRRFRPPGLGIWHDTYPVPRRALRRLASWASLSVVARDRRGREHRQTLRGPDVVDVYVGDEN
jgi:hypothetical protein